MYGHPTQQVGTEDISQSAGDRTSTLGDGQGRSVLFLIFETAIACMSKHAGNTTKHLLDSQAPIPCQTSSFTREFSLSTNQSAPLEVNVSRFCRGKSIFKYLPAPRPFVTQRATNARRASALGNTRVRPQPHTPPNVLGDREAFIRTRRGTHSPPSGSRVPRAQCSLWPVYSRRLPSPESAPSARL